MHVAVVILLVVAVLTPWRQLWHLTRIERIWAVLVCCNTVAVFGIMDAPYTPPGPRSNERTGEVALAALAALLLWGVWFARMRYRAGLSGRPLFPIFVIGTLPLLLIGLILVG